METLMELIPFAIKSSLLLLVFAIGLDASFSDLAYVSRRPGLLLRSVMAINVVVPAFAVLLALALPLMPLAKIVIVLMAVSPLPPLVPVKELKLGGRKAYVYGLLVSVSVLSIIIVPLTVALLSAIFPGNVSLSPMSVARAVLISVLLPLAIGMAVQRLTPQIAGKGAPIVSGIANAVLVLACIPLLIALWPAMWNMVGNGTVLAIAAVVAVGIAAGQLLGGPDQRDRTALAVASAVRHPGIAILIANENNADPRIKAAILLFLIVGLIVLIPYQVWTKRQRSADVTQPLE